MADTSTNGGENGTIDLIPGDLSITVDKHRTNRNLFLFLLACDILLVLIDIIFNYVGLIDAPSIRRMANIAREDGIATWYMTTQTIFAGAILLMIFIAARRSTARRAVSFSWLIFSLFFFYMAADDASQIHERLGTAIEDYAAAPTAGGGHWLGRVLDFFPSYAWQLFILPFFVIMGVYLFAFLWKQLADNNQRALLIIAIDCFMFALFLDFIEGLDAESRLNFFTLIKESTPLSSDFVDHFARSLEEFLEMFAMTLFILIFFKHFQRVAPRFRVAFLEKEDGGLTGS